MLLSLHFEFETGNNELKLGSTKISKLTRFTAIKKRFKPTYVLFLSLVKNITVLVGSPGQVAMGGDSCSEGCGFESQRRILDGLNIYSHILVVRIVMFVRKDENK